MFGIEFAVMCACGTVRYFASVNCMESPACCIPVTDVEEKRLFEPSQQSRRERWKLRAPMIITASVLCFVLHSQLPPLLVAVCLPLPHQS